MKIIGSLTLATLMVVSASTARAERADAWIATKARIALLTTDDSGGTGVNIDTEAGKITLRGKVATQKEKATAEATVKQVEGVKSVRNLIVVVPESQRKAVKAVDADIKKNIEVRLEKNVALADVDVKSVEKGLVLLGGETKTLGEKLAAIELAYEIDGVTRVASDIKTGEE